MSSGGLVFGCGSGWCRCMKWLCAEGSLGGRAGVAGIRKEVQGRMDFGSYVRCVEATVLGSSKNVVMPTYWVINERASAERGCVIEHEAAYLAQTKPRLTLVLLGLNGEATPAEAKLHECM